jgi:DNA-binding response OmpR family regulator
VDRSRRGWHPLALASGGHAVSAAYAATEAIAALEGKRRDLVVVDVRAPAAGLALAAELRERFDVPFLFLSAGTDEETVRRATALGALAFLVKPRDFIECIPTIETALARAEELWGLRLRVARHLLAPSRLFQMK